MTSTARIQPAPIAGVFGAMVKRFSKKLLGEVPEPVGVYFHNRPVLKAFLAVSSKAQKWSLGDGRPSTRSLFVAQLAET